MNLYLFIKQFRKCVLLDADLMQLKKKKRSFFIPYLSDHNEKFMTCQILNSKAMINNYLYQYCLLDIPIIRYYSIILQQDRQID
jgi:hypothetical protein